MQTENKNGGHLYFQDFYLKDKKGAFSPSVGWLIRNLGCSYEVKLSEVFLDLDDLTSGWHLLFCVWEGLKDSLTACLILELVQSLLCCVIWKGD